MKRQHLLAFSNSEIENLREFLRIALGYGPGLSGENQVKTADDLHKMINQINTVEPVERL